MRDYEHHQEKVYINRANMQEMGITLDDLSYMVQAEPNKYSLSANLRRKLHQHELRRHEE